MAPSEEDTDDTPIDLDRVVIDGDYRRAVMRRLREDQRGAAAVDPDSSKQRSIRED